MRHGPEYNLLEPGPASCRQVVLPFPVIDDNDLAKIVHINDDGDLPGFGAHVIDGRYEVAGGGALQARLARDRPQGLGSHHRGPRGSSISPDRGARWWPRMGGQPGQGSEPEQLGQSWPSWQEDGPAADRARTSPEALLAPIPSLLLTGSVHHHLIAERTRTMAGLVVESGDARECHHIALLLGYGAAAVCPYLAIESAEELVRRGVLRDVVVLGGSPWRRT